MNKSDLGKIRQLYPIDKTLKKYNTTYLNLGLNNQKSFSYITDDEVLAKVNSGAFKKHPIYPIIVKYNGKEIYDLRDNLKLYIRRNKQGSKTCRILGIGRIMVSRITAESWYNKIIAKYENVHHVDGNKDNNYFKNLMILNKEEHVELHRNR